MKRVALLENPIQHYDWGSTTALAELLGREPAPRPEAELWMGAHPSAPSRVVCGKTRPSLLELVQREPDAILGPGVCARFGARLPFLFKVLAVAQPLSIQAHPDADQARAGFLREERSGIPSDAARRSYRDTSPKPELLCALGPFRALKGFRCAREIRERLDELPEGLLADARRSLDAPDAEQALRGWMRGVLELDPSRRESSLRAVADHARARSSGDEPWAWVARLHDRHPGDAGILAPLFLHLVELAPGQAMFVPAGELHCYLEGNALEIMANSDNVLRGGLTPKHVDVEELLSILRYRESAPERIEARHIDGSLSVYPSPAEEFELSVVRVQSDRPWLGRDEGAVAILLCTDGEVRITTDRDPVGQRLVRGASCLLPAAAGACRAEGRATLFRAGLPRRP